MSFIQRDSLFPQAEVIFYNLGLEKEYLKQRQKKPQAKKTAKAFRKNKLIKSQAKILIPLRSKAKLHWKLILLQDQKSTSALFSVALWRKIAVCLCCAPEALLDTQSMSVYFPINVYK